VGTGQYLPKNQIFVLVAKVGNLLDGKQLSVLGEIQ
jgi:hypothetical protein